MFLRKVTDLFKTFQFRLALYYAGLTTLALLATFAVGHILLRKQLLNEAQSRQRNVMGQLAEQYLGETMEKSPEKVDLNQWPESVRNVFISSYPEMLIGLIEKQDQPDGVGYEVMGSTGTKRMEIVIAPSGESWISHQEPIQDVFNSLQALLADRGMIDAGGNPQLLLLSPAGTVLAGTMTGVFLPGEVNALHEYLGSRHETRLLGSKGLCIMVRRLFDGNILCIADDFYLGTRVLRRWRIFFLSLIAFFLPLSCTIGWFLSGRAMNGVKRVTSAAHMVEDGNLQARVQSHHEGIEIENLAKTFNSMTSRIELLMRELKDVTVNIAHDLRTPITRIRGLIETTDWKRAPDTERSEITGMVIEECDRLTPLVNDILELAQAETGMLELRWERFDLSAEVQKAVSIFSALAEDKHIDLKTELPTAPVDITGDRSRLQRVVANLLDNAIKYTPPGGWVCIRLVTTEKHLQLEVVDNGAGIPHKEEDRVFERFYRGTPGRSMPGNGLGLSIVKAFVSAHGGRIHLVHNHLNGCTAVVQFPLNQTSDS